MFVSKLGPQLFEAVGAVNESVVAMDLTSLRSGTLHSSFPLDALEYYLKMIKVIMTTQKMILERI